MHRSDIGMRNMVMLQPSQYSKVGFVQNHDQLGHRRTKSQESLPLELPPEQRHLFQALTSKKRKLFQELNLDDINDSSTKKRKVLRELNVEAQGWTVFRMLVPAKDDGVIKGFNSLLKPRFEKNNVEVDFQFVAGVGIAMVSAKNDSRHSTTHAIDVFDEVHKYFLSTMPCQECCLTRLLVPAANAKKLIIFDTLKSYPCNINIYLTDNMSVFSPGGVIVDIEGESEDVREAALLILSDLREFGIDEKMLLEFKAGDGIRPSSYEISSFGFAYLGLRAPRRREIIHSRRIPLLYIDYIMGKDGANLDNIFKSSPTSVILKKFSLKEVLIYIVGESVTEVKAAEKVMEAMGLKSSGDLGFSFLV
ncbi:unnamed protein product [Cuscuta campestris]|uniref:K Homology domain-containing protein n=1 Tax=Cuscuta campestris TaxID=132261 RepID=A0A484K2Z0_9ASTE|nr:unnamed protein product [Cuscuta campestris]